MADYTILRSVKLLASHFEKSKSKHIVEGEEMPRPFMLQIIQYEGDEGYYLFYMNEKGDEMTDTFHISLESAFEQAEWEFGVQRSEWIDT